MSARPPVAVWLGALRDSELDGTAVFLGAMLTTWVGRGMGPIWPSRATIARACRFKSVRTVDGGIARLERSGFLYVVHSRGKRPNEYYLALPTAHPAAPLEENNRAKQVTQRRKSPPPTAHPAAPEVLEVLEVPRRAHTEVRAASLIRDELCGLDTYEPASMEESLETSYSVLAKLHGTDLAELVVAPPGACNDRCGHDGARFLVGRVEVCRRCALRRKAAMTRVTA